MVVFFSFVLFFRIFFLFHESRCFSFHFKSSLIFLFFYFFFIQWIIIIEIIKSSIFKNPILFITLIAHFSALSWL
jgi:hypothetical protein